MPETPSLSATSDPAMTALFATGEVRPHLLALHAWHEEIAGLPLRISEPAIGAMRMEWHREAIRDAFGPTPTVRRNPLIESIARLQVLPGAPTAETLIGVIDGYGVDFEGADWLDSPALLARVDQTYGVILQAACRLMNPKFSPMDGFASLGRAWGLSEIVRAFSVRASKGLPVIPNDHLDATGMTRARLASGREPDLAALALGNLIDLAQVEYNGARVAARAMPAQLFPAIGQIALVGGYLKRARAVKDPYRSPVRRSQFSRQLVLLKASLTGRI